MQYEHFHLEMKTVGLPCSFPLKPRKLLLQFASDIDVINYIYKTIC